MSEYRVTRPSETPSSHNAVSRELLNAYERGLGERYGITRERS